MAKYGGERETVSSLFKSRYRSTIDQSALSRLTIWFSITTRVFTATSVERVSESYMDPVKKKNHPDNIFPMVGFEHMTSNI